LGLTNLLLVTFEGYGIGALARTKFLIEARSQEDGRGAGGGATFTTADELALVSIQHQCGRQRY